MVFRRRATMAHTPATSSSPTSSPISHRIPLALQRIFLSSSSGQNLDNLKPPTDDSANKIFYFSRKAASKDLLGFSLRSSKQKKSSNQNKNSRKKSSSTKQYKPTKFSNVCPQIYLDDLMHSRGYSIQKFETLDTESYVISDPRQRPRGYNSTQLLDLAREGNDTEIIRMLRENSTLCLFQYASSRGDEGETLIHMICKYCTRPDTLEIFLKQTGVDIRVSDEFGRTPLHYACWRDEPCFQMIDNMISSRDMIDMFLLTDLHGSAPLSYVPRNRWKQYISYINSKKNTWFLPKSINPKNEGKCVRYYTPKACNYERRTLRKTSKSNYPIAVVTTIADRYLSSSPKGGEQISKASNSNSLQSDFDDGISKLSLAEFEEDCPFDDDSTTYNGNDDSQEEYYFDLRQEDQVVRPPPTRRRSCFH